MKHIYTHIRSLVISSFHLSLYLACSSRLFIIWEFYECIMSIFVVAITIDFFQTPVPFVEMLNCEVCAPLLTR
jgi:hypothetical protein